MTNHQKDMNVMAVYKEIYILTMTFQACEWETDTSSSNGSNILSTFSRLLTWEEIFIKILILVEGLCEGN